MPHRRCYKQRDRCLVIGTVYILTIFSQGECLVWRVCDTDGGLDGTSPLCPVECGVPVGRCDCGPAGLRPAASVSHHSLYNRNCLGTVSGGETDVFRTPVTCT